MMTGNEDPPITADQVLQFLSENPDFLHRLTGKNLAIDAADGKIVDLTPAIAKRARNEARRMGQQNQSIFKLAAENMVIRRRGGGRDAGGARRGGAAETRREGGGGRARGAERTRTGVERVEGGVGAVGARRCDHDGGRGRVHAHRV